MRDAEEVNQEYKLQGEAEEGVTESEEGEQREEGRLVYQDEVKEHGEVREEETEIRDNGMSLEYI